MTTRNKFLITIGTVISLLALTVIVSSIMGKKLERTKLSEDESRRLREAISAPEISGLSR